ncbi:MAG: FeoC-like transcriptional regulator [Anaerolineales bacterium]
MYSKVLHELESAQGTIRLEDLAGRVGIDPSALKSMLEFWVLKGRLRTGEMETADIAACSGACGQSCPGAAQCVFVARMPTMYGVVRKKELE